MSDRVRYALEDGVALITMDDGKRNALNPTMIRDIRAALDRAQREGAIVILQGRPETFSAGFDLKIMGRSPLQTLKMLWMGFGLSARVLTHPDPVVVACTGHCMAMGVFLMLAGDYAIGAEGDFQIAANEVAIGLPLPRVAEAMLRHRLRPADLQRAALLAEPFSPAQAKEAGFVDAVAPPDLLLARARAKAAELAALDRDAHRRTKQRLRGPLARRIRWSIPLDLIDGVLLGIRRAQKK